MDRGNNGKPNHHNKSNNSIQSQENHLNDKEIDAILKLSPDNVIVMIKSAEKFAKNIQGMSSSKLRDFYDYVINIDADSNDNWFVELHLLKPKISYQRGKSTDFKETNNLKNFENGMIPLINRIDGKDEYNSKIEFGNFKKFFEAIVAYHKIYSKK